MMAANYGGIKAWVWKKVSHFDYDKYWKMREYVTSHRGGVKAYYYLYRIKKMDAYHMRLWKRILVFGLLNLRIDHTYHMG